MIVEIEDVPVHLAHADELPVRWVGQEELMRQLLAAWMVVNEQDFDSFSCHSVRARR